MGIQTITTIEKDGSNIVADRSVTINTADVLTPSAQHTTAGIAPDGFLWSRGERNMIFSAPGAAGVEFTSGTTIKIQASFGQDGYMDANDANNYVPHPTDPHDWIYLTDAEGQIVEVKGDDILSVKLGQCKLRFVVTAPAGLPANGVKVKIS